MKLYYDSSSTVLTKLSAQYVEAKEQGERRHKKKERREEVIIGMWIMDCRVHSRDKSKSSLKRG